MTIDLSEAHGFKILSISGQVSQLKDSIALKSAVNALLEEKADKIAFGLRSMEYLDSAAINVLIYAKNQIQKNGGKFCILEPNEYALDVIGVVGLKDFFPILKDREELKQL